MPYLTGSPNYLSSAGSPLAYVSLDGVEVWKATVQELLESYRKFNGTGGYTFEIPTGTNYSEIQNDTTKGITFQFFFENWEPVLDTSVRVLYTTPFATLQQRRVGANGYALQFIANLIAGGTSTTNWDNFNPRGFTSGWLRAMIFSYGGLAEINGYNESVFLGYNSVAYATEPTQGSVFGTDSVVMDVRECRVWNETFPGWYYPTVTPALEFIGGSQPPAPSTQLIGTVPSVTRAVENHIKDLYTESTPGIPIHFDWTLATINSSRAVGYVPNIGTLGYILDGSRSGSGSYYTTADGTRMTRTSSNTAYLLHPRTYNLIGHRAFLVLKPTLAIAGDFKILGASLGSAAGQRTNLVWIKRTNTLSLNRWNGTSAALVANFTLPVAMDTHEAIYEIEMSPTTVSVWVNGQHIDTVEHSAPDFNINRLIQGYDSPGYYGTMGDYIVMRSDGSAACEEAATAIRTYLSTRYSVSLV